MMRSTSSIWQTAGTIVIIAAIVVTLVAGVVAMIGWLRHPRASSASAILMTEGAPPPEETGEPSDGPAAPSLRGSSAEPSPSPESRAVRPSPLSTRDGSQRLQRAIKEGQVDWMLEVGASILADDPENLNLLHVMAFQLRERELLASPRDYTHATEAADLSRRAIALIESGNGLAGVEGFDRNATLAWLYQNLAIVEARDGMSDRAVELYEKSTRLAPGDPAIAGRNLEALIALREQSYDEASSAFNALLTEARGATEPSAEVEAARSALNVEADALIDVAARFVALAEVMKLPQATRDRVYAALESAYRARNPDDAEAAGLQAVIDSKK